MKCYQVLVSLNKENYKETRQAVKEFNETFDDRQLIYQGLAGTRSSFIYSCEDAKDEIPSFEYIFDNATSPKEIDLKVLDGFTRKLLKGADSPSRV